MKNVNYAWDQFISINVLKINVYSLYKVYLVSNVEQQNKSIGGMKDN